MAATAHAGEGKASATMAVSVTVLDPAQIVALEGERFVAGTGTQPICKTDEKCADAPLPKMTFSGAANSGTRTLKTETKR